MAIRFLLLLSVFSIVGISCKKNDFLLLKKLCQIKQVVREGGPTQSGTINYSYNSKRQLSELTHNFGFMENLQFEYDNQGRPVTILEGAIVKNKLIYQNGLLVRVDRFDSYDQLFDQAFFTYDNRQRLISREGFVPDFTMEVYEYEGQSTNPKRKLLYGTPVPTPGTQDIPPGLELQQIYEYTYDNKINPQATLVGQPLSPFYFGQQALVELFEPIAKNNIVHQKFLVKSGDSFIKFQEYFITYVYNNQYPVSESHRKVFYGLDPSTTPEETLSTATYTYECQEGNPHQ